MGASSVGARFAASFRISLAETVHPGDFGKKPDHLMERHNDADAEHADDQAVKPRIGKECFQDLRLKDVGDQSAEHDEHQHPEEKDAGRREFC